VRVPPWGPLVNQEKSAAADSHLPFPSTAIWLARQVPRLWKSLGVAMLPALHTASSLWHQHLTRRG